MHRLLSYGSQDRLHTPRMYCSKPNVLVASKRDCTYSSKVFSMVPFGIADEKQAISIAFVSSEEIQQILFPVMQDLECNCVLRCRKEHFEVFPSSDPWLYVMFW